MAIFRDESDYERFVEMLADVIEDFELECWNYCLMPNHYHVTLQPSRRNLSNAMATLNGEYARWWNRRYQHVGHVFQGRFGDRIVDRDKYLRTLTRYVARNPVAGKLVERPEDWRWGSYRAIAGLDPVPAFLKVTSTLQLFGPGDDAELQRRFVEAVATSNDSPASVDLVRSKERVLGSREFRRAVKGLRRSR
jgi:REP element-mobilizing transposase RayT